MANTKEYRFEIFKSEKDKKFYWHMVAVHGGKVVAQSEGYQRRNNAKETVLNIAGCFKKKPIVWLMERDGVTPVKY